MTKKRIVIMLAMGLVGTKIASKIWNYFISSQSNVVDEKRDLIAEVLVFSERSKICLDHSNTGIQCDKIDCPVGNVGKLQRYLRASTTLDVCMYVLTSNDLIDVIIRSHRRGAIVRIITDSSMSKNSACNIQLLRMQRAGIQIRTNRSDPQSLMHHKFAVIDGEILLFGSTNWTKQAFYGNNDSIIATNFEELVTRYSNEFEKMWTDFET